MFNFADFCGVLTANENLTVFADGSLVGYNVNGGGLYTAKWFSFPSKTKVIAVYVTNGPVWRGEFIGVFSNGVLTDSSWKCKETDNPENGWEQGNFNDDAWPHAYIRVNNSGPTIYGIPTNVHWISPENHVAMSRFICRRRFSEKEENTVSSK